MEIFDLLKQSEEEGIRKACSVLLAGGIVIYPTETVYGIGVDATNPQAVEKLLAYKSARDNKPISIAVSNKAMAEEYALLNETADNLYNTFLPGPITVISEGRHKLAPYVESLEGTIGIRFMAYPLIPKIVEAFGKPITATSANASYQRRPYKIDDILDTISEKQKDLIDLVLDVGPLPHTEPSTVVDTRLNALSVLRQGDIVLTDFTKKTSMSPEETEKIAEDLLQSVKDLIGKKSIIFALQGDMGAGKTQFAKGIGKALGITRIMASPTYTLENEYPFINNESRHMLVHIDTWRMFSKEEFNYLEIDKRLENKDIIVIEWAEKVYPLLKETTDKAHIIWVKMSNIAEKERELLYSDTFLA